MGKKDGYSGIMVSEGMIERLLESLEKISASSAEMEANREKQKLNLFAEERDALRREFKRVEGILEKYDPKTREYREIAQSLHDITSMFMYVDG